MSRYDYDGTDDPRLLYDMRVNDPASKQEHFAKFIYQYGISLKEKVKRYRTDSYLADTHDMTGAEQVFETTLVETYIVEIPKGKLDNLYSRIEYSHFISHIQHKESVELAIKRHKQNSFDKAIKNNPALGEALIEFVAVAKLSDVFDFPFNIPTK
jgi:hypothetical protein